MSTTHAPAGWEAAVLNILQVPDNASNEGFLAAWAPFEQSVATNNPLNVTQPKGTSAINSAGVQNYATAQQGEQATAAFLSFPNYTEIIDALKSGDATHYATSPAPSSTVPGASRTQAIQGEVTKWGTPNFAHEIARGTDATASVGGDFGTVAAAVGPSISGVAGGVASGAESALPGSGTVIGVGKSLVGDVSGLTSWLTNPLRILQLVFGAALVIVGLFLLARNGSTPIPVPV